MNTRKVNNKVRLAGQLVYVRFNDKNAVMVIDTGKTDDRKHSNYPRAIAFEKVLGVAQQYKTGDYVLIDATLQANDAASGLPARTIAINHISRLNPESENYHATNRFDFYGNISEITKLTANRVRAVVTVYGGRKNRLTVYFDSQDEEAIKNFCNLAVTDFVHLTGSIHTSRILTDDEKIKFLDSLVVSNFQVIPKKTTK